MNRAVLDASVFVAAISPSEVHHALAHRLYGSYPEDQAFLIPTLFVVEVLSALARRGETREFLDTAYALVLGPRFHTVAIDTALIEQATHIARVAKLRAYDAVYAALALERNASLLTLDADVLTKMSEAFPRVLIINA